MLLRYSGLFQVSSLFFEFFKRQKYENSVTGINISMEKLNLCLLSDGKTVLEWTVENSATAIRGSLQGVLKRYGTEAPEVLICAKYTGQYGYPPVSERDLYMSDRSKYRGQFTDWKRFMDRDDYRNKACRMNKVPGEPETAIDEIEAGIRDLIRGDETLKRQYGPLLSVDGAGERTAVKMIVETNAFRDFDSARKFCCHAGVASFRYDSGSSVRSRSKVSARADKSIKALLHMVAMSAATRTKGELSEYCIRKVILL